MFVDHCTDFALDFVEFFHTPMYHTRTRSAPQLQISFSCMRLHRYGSRDRKEDWKTRSEGCQCRVFQDVQRFFSKFDPAQTGGLVMEKAANPTPQNTRKQLRRFLGDGIEEKDIIIVTGVLQKRFEKKQALVGRSTATKKANTPRVGNEQKDEREDHSKCVDHLDDK